MGEALIVRRGTAPEIELFIEPGLVVEFFGLSTALPEGWLLCDGNNGTPNLIDKFIIGAGDTYAIGAQGGSADAITVAHTHTATTSSGGGHSHTFGLGIGTLSGGISDGPQTNTASTTANGAHSHSSNVIDNSGETATGKNLPPYLSLVYIIKGEN
jgi:microcystin-dependent protein